MIIRSSFLLTALVSSTCHGFSPLMQQPKQSSISQQYQRHGGSYRTSTRLFDSEQTSLWEAQKWSVEYGGKDISVDTAAMASAEAELKAFASNNININNNKYNNMMNTADGVNPDTGLVSPDAEKMKGRRKIRANVRETGTDSMKNYIKSMCNHELLNKNEEIILAREIQILLKWEKEREELEQQLLRYVEILWENACTYPVHVQVS